MPQHASQLQSGVGRISPSYCATLRVQFSAVVFDKTVWGEGIGIGFGFAESGEISMPGMQSSLHRCKDPVPDGCFPQTLQVEDRGGGGISANILHD